MPGLELSVLSLLEANDSHFHNNVTLKNKNMSAVQRLL